MIGALKKILTREGKGVYPDLYLAISKGHQ